MAELLLRDFRSVSCVDDETGDAVTKRVKSAARNIERVKDRPELILDDLVAGWWPPVAVDGMSGQEGWKILRPLHVKRVDFLRADIAGN